MPQIDVNLKRQQNVQVNLEDFWTDNINLNNPGNKLFPLDWVESTEHSSSKNPSIKDNIFIPLGKNKDGYVTFDLSLGHHLLAGGSMLSGVGMFRRVALLSLLKAHTPETIKLVIIDPIKIMSEVDSIPHLQLPRATTLEEAIKALRWCEEETNRRYELLIQTNTSTIWHYNKYKSVETPMVPSIVIFISELGDLQSVPHFDTILYKIASMSRATNIHFIITTQQPSSDTITTTIRDTFENRIAFQMPYEAESSLFIDQSGAEELLGQGDMLVKDARNDTVIHLQGLYYPVDQTPDLIQKLV